MSDAFFTSSPNAPVLEIEAFAKAFLSDGPPSGEYALSLRGKPVLPVRVFSNKSPDKAVIFAFHGAVNQTLRKIPVYFGSHIAEVYGQNATIIGIADPSLRVAPDSLITWYAGDHELPVPEAVAELAKTVNTIIAPERFIFLGGSSGSHAVLHHSHRVPGSIALVANPIIKMRHGASADRYVKLCWPGRSVDEVIGPIVADDVIERYSAGYDNTVVFLQNCFDNHFRYQGLPLLQALTPGKQHVFLNEYFKDFVGHVYPADPWLHWVGALLGARKGDLVDITDMAKRLSLEAVPAKPAVESGDAKPKKGSPSDVAGHKRRTDLADRMAQDLLEAN